MGTLSPTERTIKYFILKTRISFLAKSDVFDTKQNDKKLIFMIPSNIKQSYVDVSKNRLGIAWNQSSNNQ